MRLSHLITSSIWLTFLVKCRARCYGHHWLFHVWYAFILFTSLIPPFDFQILHPEVSWNRSFITWVYTSKCTWFIFEIIVILCIAIVVLNVNVHNVQQRTSLEILTNKQTNIKTLKDHLCCICLCSCCN